MQGRLLPKYKSRYQAFPIGMWKEEFLIAKNLGLDLIEFILDFNDVEKNPLIKKDGIQEIISVIQNTGVGVQTICADYFMEAPLHSSNPIIVKNSQKTLLKLINNAKNLGVTDIIIPCVDHSSLKDQETIDRFVENMFPILSFAEKSFINLSLETDLDPSSFIDLLNRFQSNCIKVNYDIGNSSALGYDFEEELAVYGNLISDIHIKDRVRNGGSVELGKGDVDFEKFFKKLKQYEFKGPFILQAYRDDEGVEIFKKQFLNIMPIIKNFYI
jgi:L-ribulose-5-phosphate 3-epimerase UlaE